MEEAVLNAENFEDIVLILASFATDKKISTKTLLNRFAGPISQLQIDGLRKHLRVGILKDLKDQVHDSQPKLKTQKERLVFINKFFLYTGLAKYYQNHPAPDAAIQKGYAITMQ